MTNETTASQPKSIGDDALWARTEDIRLRFANPTSIPRSTLLHYAECLLAHLAILRAPAAQASATIQAAPDLPRLPEPEEVDNVRWAYSADQMRAYGEDCRAATTQEPVMVAEPDHMGIECHYYDIGPARKAFYEGVRAVGARLEAIAKGWDGCNAHGIDSGKGEDIGADLRKSFASIGAAPMVADPAGVANKQLLENIEELPLAATVKAVPKIRITLRQARRLVEFFGGHDADMTVTERPADWGQVEEGLYAFCTEYPEDGAQFLGATETDDELMRLDSVKAVPSEVLKLAAYRVTSPNTGKERLMKKSMAKVWDRSGYIVTPLYEVAAPLADKTGGGE